MNDKSSAQTSAGSDKSMERLGMTPLGGWAGPHPGYSAPLVAESTRTHSVFMGWLPWQAEAGHGTGSFPSTDIIQGHSKDRII